MISWENTQEFCQFVVAAKSYQEVDIIIIIIELFVQTYIANTEQLEEYSKNTKNKQHRQEKNMER